MKKNLKKSLFITGFIMIVLSLVFISGVTGVKGRTSSSINGDAIYYQDMVYLATANSGAAELYEIDNTRITQVATINAMVGNSRCQGFVDAVLNVEPRGLFLFLTDGDYVYKYDINDPSNPIMFKRSNDNTNSRFVGLGKMDNKVFSVSDQGVKVWNDDMEVVYNANLNNSLPHNLTLSKKGSFIFNIFDGKLEIYNKDSQKLVSSIYLQINNIHTRKIYNDEVDSTVYLVDDRAVKQVDFNGNIIKSFKHTSTQGYDIAYTPGDDHLYFSDGIGIVKLRKSDLKPLSWIYTKNFSGASGWATSLKVVRDNYGEKIIIFDNNEIIILNQDYKKVGTIIADNNNQGCLIAENLSLTINDHHAMAGSSVTLSGRGYDSTENLSIYLANRKIDSTRADSYGRYSKTIIIPRYESNTPEFKPGNKIDIRVAGDSSGKSYSTNFQIDGTVDQINPPVIKPLISKSHGLPGDEVVLNGRGFIAGEFIFIYFSDKPDGTGNFSKYLGSVYADSTGSFSKTVVIPDVCCGKYEIKVGPEFGNGYIINFQVDNNYENILHRTERDSGEIWGCRETR